MPPSSKGAGSAAVLNLEHIDPEILSEPALPQPQRLDAVRESELLWACARGDVIAARRMLDNKSANQALLLKARDCFDFGPLHFACASGNLSLVRFLCEPPCEVDIHAAASHSSGETPVVIAAKYGHMACVQYLADQHRALFSPNAPNGWDAWSKLLSTTVVNGGDSAAKEDFKPLQPVLAINGINKQPSLRGNVGADVLPDNRRAVRNFIYNRLQSQPDTSGPSTRTYSAQSSQDGIKTATSSAGDLSRGDKSPLSSPRNTSFSRGVSPFSPKEKDMLNRQISPASAGSAWSERSDTSSLRDRRGMMQLSVITADAKGEKRSTLKCAEERAWGADPPQPAPGIVLVEEGKKEAEEEEEHSAKVQAKMQKGCCIGFMSTKKKDKYKK